MEMESAGTSTGASAKAFSFLSEKAFMFLKDVVMKTNFKRLIRIYDWLIYGHKK